MWGCVGSLFCDVIRGAISSLAINMLRKREMVALRCHGLVSVIHLRFWAYGSLDSLFPIPASPTANL